MINKYIFEFNQDFINQVINKYVADKTIKTPARLFYNEDSTNEFTTAVMEFESGGPICLASNIESATMLDWPFDKWKKWQDELNVGLIKVITIAVVSEEY